MPNDFQIVGSSGYTPTTEQINRVRTFLKWLPAKVKPESVIILPPNEFKKIERSRPSASRNPTEVSFSAGKRSYITTDLFKPNARIDSVINAKFPAGNALEWVLAHEAAHMNSSLSPAQQELQDDLFNDTANETIKHWNSKPALAYRASQSIAAKLPGEFEPSHAPLGTDLTPPQSPVTPNSMPTPAPSSQPNGLLSLARIGAHIPFAVLGALGAASRKENL